MIACKVSTLIMFGVWQMLWHFSSDYDAWKSCPQTYQFVANDRSPKEIAHHIPKYTCYNRTYMVSKYEAPSCHFNDFEESVKQLDGIMGKQPNQKRSTMGSGIFSKRKRPDMKSHTKRIFYVGDSLTIQLFIAARCALETYNLQHVIEAIHLVDPFLRNDLPCDDRCATDPVYFNHSRRRSCDGCADDGRKKEYWRDYVQDPDTWLHRIPTDTIALVIGTGTWYNHMKTIMDHQRLFEDTIDKTVSVLTTLRRERPEMSVFWLGLPPILSSEFFDKYDWKRFNEKDAYAASRMIPAGVHYVNVTRLTWQRKNVDYNSCSDGLHWCAPGEHSVPFFLNRVIFQWLLEDLRQQG